MAQMKQQIKNPEKELSNKERANLSDAEFNTGNQDAHRNGWVQSQNRGKSEAMKSEIKENAQGTNSDEKETGKQINDFEQKEKIL